MTVLWIDASAGASGDMLLGALVDVGVPLEVVQAAIDPLELGITLRSETVQRSALGATKVHVDVPAPRTVRHLPDILELLERLPDSLAATAGAVFARLAEAEASVHRVGVDQVHFHEVGALDAIADIVGVVAGFHHLSPTTVVCSTLGLGSGHAHTEHGRIPVPVPAVVELVAGVPSAAGPAPFEAMTPTGAALLVTLADDWGPMPALQIEAAGSGAGTRDAAEFANIVRIVRGNAPTARTAGSSGEPEGVTVESALQIEANVDDLDPRVWPSTIQALLDAGAQDAWIAPITMKKGRPAFTISVLCDAVVARSVRAVLFAHTSTIGLREYPVTKHVLPRRFGAVEVEGRSIAIKLAGRSGAETHRSVEWDDVIAAAEALGRTPKDVLESATRLAADLVAERSIEPEV